MKNKIVNILYKNRTLNILESILLHLNIKYTKDYTNKIYNEHPYKYSLYGISKMLFDYGIKNAGVRISDMEKDLYNIQTPFISLYGGDFVCVYKVTNEKVYFNWEHLNISISPTKFLNSCESTILLVESNKKSIEPNFFKNRTLEKINHIKNRTVYFFILYIFFTLYFKEELYENIKYTALLILNLIGVFNSILLFKTQIKMHSTYSNKICSLFHKSDCNNILHSDASKLWGIISWSEIGFGYFFSNILLILLTPHLTTYLVYINAITLPYSFWSVWYQSRIVKQWCPLCLIAQVLLWSIFISSYFFNLFKIIHIDLFDISSVILIYSLPLIAINKLFQIVIKSSKTENIMQELNSLKTNDVVFNAIIKQQQKYEIDKSVTNLKFGNPNSKITLTIISNPHCNPCSKMHKEIEELLKTEWNKICIEFIFSSFRAELDKSNKYLIAIYLHSNAQKAIKIFSEWFKYGNVNKEFFFFKYQHLYFNKKSIDKEFYRHKNWLVENNITSTPTILINGYKLTNKYNLKDLTFLTKLDI